MKKTFICFMLILIIALLTSCTSKAILSFNTNGGKEIDPKVVDNYDPIKLPVPEKTGYTFKGWYYYNGYDNIKCDDTIRIKGDLTLNAQWEINKYSITFVTNNNEEKESIEVEFQKSLAYFHYLPREVHNNHTFIGWYMDSNFNTPMIYYMPAQDITLYAKWTKNNLPEQLAGDIKIPNEVLDNIYSFNLPKNISECSITWESTNSNIIKIELDQAIVMDVEEDVDVVLNATIKWEEFEYVKPFTIKVKYAGYKTRKIDEVKHIDNIDDYNVRLIATIVQITNYGIVIQDDTGSMLVKNLHLKNNSMVGDVIKIWGEKFDYMDNNTILDNVKYKLLSRTFDEINPFIDAPFISISQVIQHDPNDYSFYTTFYRITGILQIQDPKYYTYKLVESSNEENELFISTFSNSLSYNSYIGKLVEVNAIIFGYKDGHFSVLIISLTEVNVE